MHENYSNEFKFVDTEEKAYFLGFFHADGCLYYSNKAYSSSTRLKLNIKDEEILQKFLLKFPFFVLAYEQHMYKWKGVEKISKECLIRSYNKDLFLDLLTLDIKKDIPKLPDTLIPHFLRGMIDGDGSWGMQSKQLLKTTNKFKTYYGMTLCIDSELIFNKISAILIANNITFSKRIVSPIILLRVRKKESILNLINFLYDGTTWYLQRKEKIIQKIKNNLVQIKSDKLLENQEIDNQQPIISLND